MTLFLWPAVFAFTALILMLAVMLLIRFQKEKKVRPGARFGSFLRSVTRQPLTDFVRMNIAVILILLILRVAQYYFLSSLHSLPLHAFHLEMHGFLYDLVVWQFISMAILIPFLLFSILKRWAGVLFFFVVFLAASLLEWILFEYFKLSLTPLDEVVFSYSAKEMVLIAESSVRISFLTFLPGILLLLGTLTLFLLSLKIKLSKYLVAAFFLASISLIGLRKPLTPNEAWSRNPVEYFLSMNKSVYLTKRCIAHLSESHRITSLIMAEAAAKRYQEGHPEFNFPGTQFPFLHYDNTPDVLGGYFNFKEQKPNVVIVICESLSACFSGSNNIYGSFTPFLDSLAGQSLYWPNFLSTADRTFNVLEALTASLPPGYDSYVNPHDDAKYPYLMSLVRYLSDDGYFTGFYHGGDPSFNNMDDFLVHQRIDYVLRYFGPGYTKLSSRGIPGWGYSDLDMFNRSFEVLDSLKKSPRLDIYLTVTTHAPFAVPDQQYWLSQVDDRIRNGPRELTGKDDLGKYRQEFSAVMYFDNSLRKLMENYRKRPGYENTIFLITGDHAMPEVNPTRFSLLERFHVPMIIYSPMLKKTGKFLSVSSHLDVTPTLLAMLHKWFGLKINEVAAWLGSGIDTAGYVRNTHALPFILNNREISDFMDHLCYLSAYSLSGLQASGFVLCDMNNPPVRKKLQQELDDYKILSKYVLEQNRIVPPGIYYGKVLICDTVKIRGERPFYPGDSVWEYRNIYPSIPIDPKFRMLKLEVSIDFKVSGKNKAKLPKLVFDLKGKAGKQVIYNSYEVAGNTVPASGPGKWDQAKFTEYIDLSYMKQRERNSLGLYMWNPDHCIFRMTNPNVRIFGYY